MKKRNKKAQVFGLSFGVLFSILLIIFFIVIAFIAINAFLKTQKCAQIGIFKDDFQNEIDRTWNSQTSSFVFEGKLPSNLDYVCFANLSNSITATGIARDIGEAIGVYQGTSGNLFLYPIENSCDMPYHNIEHINLAKITSSNNPYCIKINRGNIDIQIEKASNEALVGLKS